MLEIDNFVAFIIGIVRKKILNVSFFRPMANFQLEKKRSDDLKKAQKRATTLEGELKKKGEQLATTAEELARANAKLSKK